MTESFIENPNRIKCIGFSDDCIFLMEIIAVKICDIRQIRIFFTLKKQMDMQEH